MCGNALQIFDLTDLYNFIRLDAFVTRSLILFYSFLTEGHIVLSALQIYDLIDPYNFIRLDAFVIRSLILFYSFSTQN